VFLENPLCKLLGIRYPIIQAGMAGQTTPELVAAVSNAGGLGILGATRMTPDKLLDTVRKIKMLTAKPYGVNLWLGPQEKSKKNHDISSVQEFLDKKFRKPLGLPLKSASLSEYDTNDLPPSTSKLSEQLQIVLEEKVSIASFAMGDPVKYVDQIHCTGAKIISMVTNVEDGISVAKNGSDIVMAQGAEAGGHRSLFNINNKGAHVDDNDENYENIPLIGTMALVPQIVDALKKEIKDRSIPVIAAGGIADGRGLVAALALGASGIAIGTRFLVCRESGALQGYRERLLSSSETDTVVTKAFTGVPARVLSNTFVKEYEKSGLEPLTWPLQRFVANDIYENAQTKDNANYYPLYSGQALRMLKRNQSAEEVINEIMIDAKEYLSSIDFD
jgi:nitronate monooxygenase